MGPVFFQAGANILPTYVSSLALVGDYQKISQGRALSRSNCQISHILLRDFRLLTFLVLRGS